MRNNSLLAYSTKASLPVPAQQRQEPTDQAPLVQHSSSGISSCVEQHIFSAASSRRALFSSYANACLTFVRWHKGLTLKTPTAQVCVTDTRFRAADFASDERWKRSSPYLSVEFPLQDCQRLQLSAWPGLERGWPARGELLPRPALRQHSSALMDASTSLCVSRCPLLFRDVVLQAGRDDSNDAANLPKILPKAKRRDSHDSSRSTTRPAFRASHWAIKAVPEIKTSVALEQDCCTSLGLCCGFLKRVHKCG